MKDYLLKAVACDEHVRIYICSSTALVEEARTRFDLWPTASSALGRTLTVGSMMGSMLKSEKEQLTIRINGGGPIGTVLVDAYSDGHVRGFVSNPHVHYQYNDTGKLAVGIAVGKEGTLEVIKDMGMKENWSGAVALQSGGAHTHEGSGRGSGFFCGDGDAHEDGGAGGGRLEQSVGQRCRSVRAGRGLEERPRPVQVHGGDEAGGARGAVSQGSSCACVAVAPA